MLAWPVCMYASGLSVFGAMQTAQQRKQSNPDPNPMPNSDPTLTLFLTLNLTLNGYFRLYAIRVARLQIAMPVCMYACVCLYVCVHVCLSVPVSVCLYVCVFICMLSPKFEPAGSVSPSAFNYTRYDLYWDVGMISTHCGDQSLVFPIGLSVNQNGQGLSRPISDESRNATTLLESV